MTWWQARGMRCVLHDNACTNSSWFLTNRESTQYSICIVWKGALTISFSCSGEHIWRVPGGLYAAGPLHFHTWGASGSLSRGARPTEAMQRRPDLLVRLAKSAGSKMTKNRLKTQKMTVAGTVLWVRLWNIPQNDRNLKGFQLLSKKLDKKLRNLVQWFFKRGHGRKTLYLVKNFRKFFLASQASSTCQRTSTAQVWANQVFKWPS